MHFRDQFIRDVDANAIVFELKNKGIISDGDERGVSQKLDATQQNQFLHDRLTKVCTDRALKMVCDILIAAKNMRMNELGEEMKSMLEGGKCCAVCSCAHVCYYMCMRLSV